MRVGLIRIAVVAAVLLLAYGRMLADAPADHGYRRADGRFCKKSVRHVARPGCGGNMERHSRRGVFSYNSRRTPRRSPQFHTLMPDCGSTVAPSRGAPRHSDGMVLSGCQGRIL